MAAESYAFISVYDKFGLVSHARHLAEHYTLVSLGGTALIIEQETGIPVLQSWEFLDDSALHAKALALRDPRERRELLGERLAQHMCQAPEVLAETGRAAIDLAYINLMPPKLKVDADGRYAGIKLDKGGINMINAAVEGGRDVVTQAEQMAGFLDNWRSSDPEPRRLEFGIEALAYVQRYTEIARTSGNLALNAMQQID